MRAIPLVLSCGFALLLSGGVCAESEGRGGQFQFSTDPATFETILRAQAQTIAKVNGLKRDSFGQIFDYKPVDKDRFIAALSNLKFNLACTRVRLNPDGQKENVMLDFGPRTDAPIFEQNCETYLDSADRIEVLERFILLVQLNKLSVTDIERNLIHETLHLFGYDQLKAWEYSDKFMRFTESEVVRLGPHALIGKNNPLREDIRRRMDYLVSKIGPNKTFGNLWGNKVVMTFNPVAGTYEVREDFYESSEAWYIVAMDSGFISSQGFAGGFVMINKSYVDGYLKAYRLNPDDALNVLWMKVEDGATQANAILYRNGSIITLGFKYPGSSRDYQNVKNPPQMTIGRDATVLYTDFFQMEDLPKSLRH